MEFNHKLEDKLQLTEREMTDTIMSLRHTIEELEMKLNKKEIEN